MTVPPKIREMIDGGALFVASHSGGKDSQAMLIRLLELVPREQVLVVHASLAEFEWHGALEHAQQQAVDAGLPFVVATAVKTFLQMVEHRYKVRPGPNSSCWPSSANRQCTSDLKRGPIEREVRRYAREHGYTRIVSCMGMRADESPARAKREPLVRSVRNCAAGRDWWEWLPIHDMPTAEVFRVIADAGQVLHPAYARNKRLSCVFCIFGAESDIRHGAEQRPELALRMIEVEDRTGYTMHQSRRSLRDIIGAELMARIDSLLNDRCPDTGRHVDDCPMCQNEACQLCGAGCGAPHGTVCEHDVVERHQTAE